MYPRTNYEMSDADLERLLEACKPVPYMVIGGMPPPSQQENANRAWAELGSRMGFDSMTVEPIQGKPMRFFTAVPNETEEQKALRIQRELEDAKAAEIGRLKQEIEVRENRLAELQAA